MTTRPPRLGSPRRRLIIAVGAAIILAAGVGIVRSRGGGDDSPPLHADSPPRHAVVDTVINTPSAAVFYGRSCPGTHGDWFLNIVQAGGNDVARAAYYLRWSFPPTEVSAAPSGRVTVSGGASATPTVTLKDGVITMSGRRADNTAVSATGKLTVRLSGSSTAPSLKITQTGVADVESALGLQSPFPSDGEPLHVPVKLVKQVAGC